MEKLKRLWYKTRAHWQRVLTIALCSFLFGGYVLGVLSTGLNPAFAGISYLPWDAYGSLFSRSGQQLIVLIVGAGLLIWLFVSVRAAKYASLEKDGRNFYMSDKGTYGTARFMNEGRMRNCFDVRPESDCHNAEGDIIGIKDGYVISLPRRSMLNHNVSVYGSSGSMKSRAVIRNQIIGSMRRGESMLITDPKGELFRDTAVWLRRDGDYLVRCLNLVSTDKSHGWNFMKDIRSEGEGMELSIVDQISHTIIQNTGGKIVSKDDFWDKAENGLLKAIILYQNEIHKQGRGPLNFPDAYRFLATHDVAQLKNEFAKLGMQDPFNPAYVQFNIFLRAGDKVCPNIHFGLLSRLGIFNNPTICSIATRDEIDLELPARRKCAYFVITSDQDSSNDFLACLFFTLFYIRIVRYADTKTMDGRCPVPVSLLLDEFPNSTTRCGVKSAARTEVKSFCPQLVFRWAA